MKTKDKIDEALDCLDIVLKIGYLEAYIEETGKYIRIYMDGRVEYHNKGNKMYNGIISGLLSIDKLLNEYKGQPMGHTDLIYCSWRGSDANKENNG